MTLRRWHNHNQLKLLATLGLAIASYAAMRRLGLSLWLGCSAGSQPDALPINPSPDANRSQGSVATGALAINEVVPRGAGPDAIELVNRSGQPIDLCNYFLTDARDRLDHYLPLGGVMPPATCVPRLLPPDAYVVIWADDTPLSASDGTHAPFELDIADEVHVLTTEGAVVDALLFLYPPGPTAPALTSLGRWPDRDGLFYEQAPTLGGANGGR